MNRLRYVALAFALVLGAVNTKPVAAEGLQEVCLGLCAAETASSGYIGEEAVYYMTGCFIGCVSSRWV